MFVPGMTDVAADYIEVLPLFGRRAVIVDLRGHGQSGAPESGYDLADLTADVGAVVDAVTDGPVHVVMFSRGTTYALAWAIETPAQFGPWRSATTSPRESSLPQTFALACSTAAGAELRWE